MTLRFLGDVHAGKQFINDVPLHRRGEREQEVLHDFFRQLLIPGDGVTLHVQVGDLFDQFKVSNEVLWSVAEAYAAAARANPSVTYLLYPGNHDLSRDSSKVSSLQILDRILMPYRNIEILWEVQAFESTVGWTGVLPWHPFKSAAELASELLLLSESKVFDVVFCHCDITGDTPNLIPLEVLKGHCKKIITGHVHIPQTYTSHNIEVVVTGSMQPYSHGEGERYITVTREELENLSNTEVEFKYVRLKLKKGESTPVIPNCMGFKIIYEDSEKITPENLAVEFKEFSTRGLFLGCLTKVGVSEITKLKVMEKFDASN